MIIRPHPTPTFLLTRDLMTGKHEAHELVPHAEADPSHGRVSIESPFGRAFATAHAGATRLVDTVHGPRRLQLLSLDDQVEW